MTADNGTWHVASFYNGTLLLHSSQKYEIVRKLSWLTVYDCESYHDWLCMIVRKLSWLTVYDCALKSQAAETMSAHWNREQLKLWVRTEIVSSWNYECALKSWAAEIKSVHWNHEQLKLWVRTEIMSSWYYECALKSRAAKIMSAHWNHEQLKLWVRTEITSKQLSKHITPLL